MRKQFWILVILLYATQVFAAPSVTISIPNSFSPNTTISSSSTNANNNEFQSKFNSHSHTDITQVSTIVSGTWNATAVTVPYGGTGLSSLTTGDVLYASASNTLSALAKSSSSTRYLSNTGASNIPAWAQVSLATGVTGNLPVTNLNSGTSAAATTFWQGDGTWSSVNLATGDVTGNLPVTNLNSGTSASSSTFWRGDGTWGATGAQLLSTTTISSADNTGDITIAADKLYLVSLMGIVSSNNDDVPILLINNSTTAGHYKDSASTDRAGIGLTNAAGTTILGANGTINCSFFINTLDNGAVKASVYGSSYIFVGSAGTYSAYAPLGIFLNAAPTSFRITNNRSFASLTVRVYEFGQ